MSYKYLFKYILVGESGVGKSCLLLQFTDRRFEPIHDLTIGVEFGARIIKVGDTNVKLQCWDSAGQEAFRSITRSYYRNASVALLVFDITRKETFDKLETWVNEVRSSNSKNTIIMLVGNKSDLHYKRRVSEKEAKTFAEKHNMVYMETSAKNGRGVHDVFKTSAEKFYTQIRDGITEISEINGIKFIQAKKDAREREQLCSCIIS